jgi:hypothetical protein
MAKGTLENEFCKNYSFVTSYKWKEYDKTYFKKKSEKKRKYVKKKDVVQQSSKEVDRIENKKNFNFENKTCEDDKKVNNNVNVNNNIKNNKFLFSFCNKNEINNQQDLNEDLSSWMKKYSL